MSYFYRKITQGNLPSNWKLVTINDISEVTAGGTPSTSIVEYWGGDIPWMNSGEINLRRIKSVENRITEAGLNNSSTKIIKENSVLMALAGQGKTRGKVAVNEIPLCTNQSLAAIFNFDGAYSEFIFQNLEARYSEIRKMSTGDGGRGGLNLKIIKSIKIGLPPLPEQQKIAEILSTVDEKIDAIDQRIAETQVLKKGLMQQLLTKGIGHTKFKDSPLGEIPESWEVVISSEIFELIHGYQFREYDFTDTGLPVVKIGQINSQGEIDMTNCSYFSEDRAEEFRDKIIFNGDVLMALTGATLGKSCWVSGLESNVYQNYRVGKFEPRDANILSKRYLYFLIGSPLVLNQIFAKVNSGAQGNIGKADFEKLKITLPSIAEQNRISKILSNVDEKLQIQQDKKTEYQALKKGLMQQLLTGKIRVSLPKT